jgi:hypothetical protein
MQAFFFLVIFFEIFLGKILDFGFWILDFFFFFFTSVNFTKFFNNYLVVDGS